MSSYYNEIDPYAAQWLRNLIARGLIADGDVDERSIVDVKADDLAGYRQCHFFAGIGGWSYALRLAGWPDDQEVWTGSCPCQPFSSAATFRAKRSEDYRHLWPHWSRLIVANRPRVVFGEQVVDAGDWIDEICDDMEGVGYQVGAAVLPACGFGFDHARHRIYFVCDSDCDSESSIARNAKKMDWVPRHRGIAQELALEDGLPSRVGAMRAYGNAIVPQVAAEFIGAYLDVKAAA